MKSVLTETVEAVPINGKSRSAPFVLEAQDVTGTHALSVRDIRPSTPAGTVAQALARRMNLPTNVPWTLREEHSAAFLDDAAPVGEQVNTGAKVTITPRAHLG